MKNYLILLLLIFCLFSRALAQADRIDEPLNGLLENLKEYQEKFPREKVYVQLDRDRYEAGEDIWFKAYTTISQFNFLSAVSRIIYVELIDSRNEIVLSSRLPVVSGLSFGDFALPDSLPDGNYRIRAYTNWMRNFDERLFLNGTS